MVSHGLLDTVTMCKIVLGLRTQNSVPLDTELKNASCIFSLLTDHQQHTNNCVHWYNIGHIGETSI